jgi:hypothetical protein
MDRGTGILPLRPRRQRERRPWPRLGVFIGLLGSGFACGEPESPAPTGPLAGTYAAASIVRQQDDLSDELIDLGARFDLTLLPDSTLTGHVMLPPNLRATGESEPVDQDLSGRWSLRKNQIDLRLDRPLLGNQPTLGAVEAGLVGTLIVPDPLNGTLWLKLLLVRTSLGSLSRADPRP